MFSLLPDFLVNVANAHHQVAPLQNIPCYLDAAVNRPLLDEESAYRVEGPIFGQLVEQALLANLAAHPLSVRIENQLNTNFVPRRKKVFVMVAVLEVAVCAAGVYNLVLVCFEINCNNRQKVSLHLAQDSFLACLVVVHCEIAHLSRSNAASTAAAHSIIRCPRCAKTKGRELGNTTRIGGQLDYNCV